MTCGFEFCTAPAVEVIVFLNPAIASQGGDFRACAHHARMLVDPVMSSPRTPRRLSGAEWHVKNHAPEVAYEDCGRCVKALTKCAGKITYATIEEARAKALALNVKRNWASAVLGYRCRYCSSCHLRTARTREERRRMERDRRKVESGRLSITCPT